MGKAYFAMNPKLPANQAIADIDKAPRNQDGLVEFSSDVFLLRPKDPKKGNGTVLYEVSNRGYKSMLTYFNRAAGSLDPRNADEFGDGLLMNQGYTLLWVGWQFDMPDTPNLVYLYPPIVQGVQGIVRAEFTPDRKEARYSVADRNHKPYTVLNPDDPNLRLTVRDQVEGPRTTIPRADWHIENGTTIVPKNGVEPGRIYELVYTSENPPVAGTGFAAVRDMISWLRYGGFVAGAPAPNATMKRAYGFGVSQSGRFLRTMLYFGFNRDDRGRKVFDGLLADVAGGGRGGFNMRFAQPSRDSNPFQNTLTPVDIFPFTDLEQTDPQTGAKDGLLTHSLPPEFWPKIFYMNSEYEYYGRAASLVHITLDGTGDAKLAPSTRIYMFSGGQHGPAQFPPARRGTQNLPNPNPYTWTFRALLAAMDAWVKDGVEPPPSKYPHVAAHELVPLASVQFPKIPGVAFPKTDAPRLPVQLRSGFPHQRHRHAGAAGTRPALSADGSASGSRRPRYRRNSHARTRRASRHLHRLEPARPRSRRAGNAVDADRLLHPLRTHQSRPHEVRRPAPLDRRTLRQQRRLSRKIRSRREIARQSALLAARRRARASQERRGGVGLRKPVIPVLLTLIARPAA